MKLTNVFLSVAVIVLISSISFLIFQYGMQLFINRKESERYYSSQANPGLDDELVQKEKEEFIPNVDVAFEDRINRLKQELAEKNFNTSKVSSVADIGAEGIYNLPHDKVNYYGGDENEEISR